MRRHQQPLADSITPQSGKICFDKYNAPGASKWSSADRHDRVSNEQGRIGGKGRKDSIVVDAQHVVSIEIETLTKPGSKGKPGLGSSRSRLPK
jgi:hypothetical protein